MHTKGALRLSKYRDFVCWNKSLKQWLNVMVDTPWTSIDMHWPSEVLQKHIEGSRRFDSIGVVIAESSSSSPHHDGAGLVIVASS